MQKRSNKYNLNLTSIQYADGTNEPSRALHFDFENHDEIFGIIDRLQKKNPFNDTAQATEFAVGLKLFSEVLLKNRSHPLFDELKEVFPVFMKKLKSL